MHNQQDGGTQAPLMTYNGLEYLDANSTAPRVALVMHWGGSSGRVGSPFARLLPDWRIIAPSFRGHGHNPLPTVSADNCGQDVLDLLDHLGIKLIERLYAYSLGAYVATRLFKRLEIEDGVLIAGGVAPLGVALPTIFDDPTTLQQETTEWLAEQRASLTATGASADEIEDQWQAIFPAYGDIFDLSRSPLTFRLSAADMRPMIMSVWGDDYFADASAPTPHRLFFWNGNDPVACKPYIEQFERHAGCDEITLNFDPFDVQWPVVARVIALLSTSK